MATARLEAAITELVAALRQEMEPTPAPHAPDRLLSIEEAARLIGVSRASAYLELQAGRLRSLKVGRRRLVPTSAISHYIAARIEEAA